MRKCGQHIQRRSARVLEGFFLIYEQNAWAHAFWCDVRRESCTAVHSALVGRGGEGVRYE